MAFQPLGFYQAPAAPAPAPSQIPMPQAPQRPRSTPPRQVEKLYAASIRVLAPTQDDDGQEYPTRLH